jgi:hypothetical protein
MGNDVNAVLDGVLKDTKRLASKAVNDAAHKGQKDIMKEAKSYLNNYYASYRPKVYERTKSLKRAIVPVFDKKSTKDLIAIEIGVEYKPELLEGVYKSNSPYHQSGDTWKVVPDNVKIDSSLFSSDYGMPEPEWILDNFLRGEHGGAQRDFNGTYTLMPDFLDNELPKKLNQYVQDAFLNTVINRLSKL